jgi:Bifunctional DNA primase/polymerase, N-terminal/Primase C terminal 1 (PriCT-1)
VIGLGAHALSLARLGLRVIPLRPNGKVPLTEHGCKDASADPEVIAKWWGQWPDANVGVATGEGLFVVDIDIKNGVEGEAAWRDLQQPHGPAPMTRTVITPSGGRHLYWDPGGVFVRCSAGRLGAGIDIRGAGGYVVAAGEIDGKRYETLPAPIAPAPPWLLELLREHAIAHRSVEDWRELASNGVEGGRRNTSVAAFAGHLFRKGVDPWVALELLRLWNQARCDPPLPDVEVVRCVNSIAAKELRRRQGLRS